jgi:hypothetical protein
MRLGPDIFSDTAYAPMGWLSVEGSEDAAGNVAIHDPDAEGMNVRTIAVSGLTVGDDYAIVFDLDLVAGWTFVVIGTPSPKAFTESGLIICTFTANAALAGFTFRVAGAGPGDGSLGLPTLRAVLDA